MSKKQKECSIESYRDKLSVDCLGVIFLYLPWKYQILCLFSPERSNIRLGVNGPLSRLKTHKFSAHCHLVIDEELPKFGGIDPEVVTLALKTPQLDFVGVNRLNTQHAIYLANWDVVVMSKLKVGCSGFFLEEPIKIRVDLLECCDCVLDSFTGCIKTLVLSRNAECMTAETCLCESFEGLKKIKFMGIEEHPLIPPSVVSICAVRSHKVFFEQDLSRVKWLKIQEDGSELPGWLCRDIMFMNCRTLILEGVKNSADVAQMKLSNAEGLDEVKVVAKSEMEAESLKQINKRMDPQNRRMKIYFFS